MNDRAPVLIHHNRYCLFDSFALPHLNRLLDRLHRRRRVVGDLLRNAECCTHKIGLGMDFIDHAQADMPRVR